jgi:hypothetical protein
MKPQKWYGMLAKLKKKKRETNCPKTRPTQKKNVTNSDLVDDEAGQVDLRKQSLFVEILSNDEIHKMDNGQILLKIKEKFQKENTPIEVQNIVLGLFNKVSSKK